MSTPIWAGMHATTIPTNPQDYIFFFSKDEVPYGCFSNAYREGHTTTTMTTTTTTSGKQTLFWCINQELHYQKAILFNDNDTAQQILDEKDDANKIKQLGRLVQGYDDSKWCEVRYEICCNAIYSKFSQNEKLKDLLLSTGSKIIVEAAKDKTWGIGCVEYATTSSEDGSVVVVRGAKHKDSGEFDVKPEDWVGSNLLGRCLMDVRKQLSDESNG